MRQLHADILIIGAGLAGLRAAATVVRTCPDARVLVADARPGPCGSSFANINDALGMCAPQDEAERAAFTAAALDIAAPGWADPALVRILAEESAARAEELAAWGVRFERAEDGSFRRFPCCFMPVPATALIFRGLAEVGSTLVQALETAGVRFLFDVELLDLLSASGPGARVLGGLLQTRGREFLCVRAGVTIASAGGPCALFGYTVSGPGGDGSFPARLVRAGAEVVNRGFFQFMWHIVPGRKFFDFSVLAGPGAAVIGPDGRSEPLPDELKALIPSRLRHCPLGYGLPDAGLDFFLVGKLHRTGCAEILASAGERFRIAPFAHAANVGVRIDENGWTGVPGLYAAGECASGMHGANRVGGAMIAATQVFGHRAGLAAIRETPTGRDAGEFRAAIETLLRSWRDDGRERRRGRAWLRSALSRTAVSVGRDEEIANLEADLEWRLNKADDSRLRDMFATALVTGASHSFSRKGK